MGSSLVFGSLVFLRRRQQRLGICSQRIIRTVKSRYTECRTLDWAKSNPFLAQECINPPVWYDLEKCRNLDGEYGPLEKQLPRSLEAYLKWRRWTFPKEVVKLREEGRDNATALISHILSAPLTLASQFRHVCSTLNKNDSGDDIIHHQWCCVGARAEASIPIVYWKEFLMLSTASSLFLNDKKDIGNSGILPTIQSLDFTGPDIPPKLFEQSLSIPINNNSNKNNGIINSRDNKGTSSLSVSTLSLRGFHRGLFHESPFCNNNQKSRCWDTYVFFNPGFGHPNLRQSWEDTLNIIIRNQGQLQRSLLLTAHSDKDAIRDSNILHNVYGLKHIEYYENPFASRIVYEDPFEKGHFVRPNHYVATVII